MTIQKTLLRFSPEKKNILPAIKAVNEDFSWVSEEAIGKIARYFEMSESHIFSVASFYDEINLKKPALLIVEVCDGANCQTKNASKIIQNVESFFKIKADNFNKQFSLKRISCLGRCLEGPVVRINGKVYTKMTADRTIALIKNKLGI